MAAKTNSPKKEVRVKYIERVGFLATLVALVIIGMLSTPVSADFPNGRDWATYKDSRLGFSLEYPAGWQIQSRTDNPDSISKVLTLTAPASSEGAVSSSISIGQYLYEINSGETLSRWMNRYPRQFSKSEIKTFDMQHWKIDGAPARYIRGASPLTQYQYTNIRRGSTVWFVWANFADTAGTDFGDIYLRVVRSLKFDKESPTTLQAIYGIDFQPLSMPAMPQCHKIRFCSLLRQRLARHGGPQLSSQLGVVRTLSSVAHPRTRMARRTRQMFQSE